MVYHRSESGSADKRQHRRDEDSGSRDSRREDRESSNSHEGQYSEPRWRNNEREERYSKNSRDSEGSDRSKRMREETRNEPSPAWGHGSANFQYNPGPRFNPGLYPEPVGFMPPMMPAYPIDNYQYLNSEAQKAEEEKKKNVFQNDGSFLEMFKRMQEGKSTVKAEPASTPLETTAGPSASTPAVPPKKLALPLVGKRRGGRVLKTGMVKKLKVEKPEDEEPKNAWSIYMNEVRKYKEASCEEEGKTRPLVK